MPVFSIFFSSNYFFFCFANYFLRTLAFLHSKILDTEVLIKIPTFSVKNFNKTQTQILNLRIFLFYVIVLIFVSHNLNLQIEFGSVAAQSYFWTTKKIFFTCVWPINY